MKWKTGKSGAKFLSDFPHPELIEFKWALNEVPGKSGFSLNF